MVWSDTRHKVHSRCPERLVKFLNCHSICCLGITLGTHHCTWGTAASQICFIQSKNSYTQHLSTFTDLQNIMSRTRLSSESTKNARNSSLISCCRHSLYEAITLLVATQSPKSSFPFISIFQNKIILGNIWMTNEQWPTWHIFLATNGQITKNCYLVQSNWLATDPLFPWASTATLKTTKPLLKNQWQRS